MELENGNLEGGRGKWANQFKQKFKYNLAMEAFNQMQSSVEPTDIKRLKYAGWAGAEIPLLALHPGHFQEALRIFAEHFENQLR